MKVLLILEDPTHDSHIVQPIVEKLLKDVGVNARVDVLRDPHLRGASEALDAATLKSIIEERRMFGAFLLVVDRDCDREQHEAKALAREGEHAGKLITCLAWQEVEVWLLALYKERLSEPSWSKIREHCDPKEIWAEPLLDELSRNGPGGGRKKAMRELSGKLRSLVSSCPELERLRLQLQALAKVES